MARCYRADVTALKRARASPRVVSADAGDHGQARDEQREGERVAGEERGGEHAEDGLRESERGERARPVTASSHRFMMKLKPATSAPW